MNETALHQLKGFGRKSQSLLQQVGVTSVAQLRAADPYEVYARLKAADPATSLNFLYAIIGAIEDRHWQEIARERRTEILVRLDEMGLAPK